MKKRRRTTLSRSAIVNPKSRRHCTVDARFGDATCSILLCNPSLEVVADLLCRWWCADGSRSAVRSVEICGTVMLLPMSDYQLPFFPRYALPDWPPSDDEPSSAWYLSIREKEANTNVRRGCWMTTAVVFNQKYDLCKVTQIFLPNNPLILSFSVTMRDLLTIPYWMRDTWLQR